MQATRSQALLYAAPAFVAICACFFLCFTSMLGALVGVIAAVGGSWLMRQRRAPDLVVGSPLLNNAVSPELASEMAALEHQALTGELEKERPAAPVHVIATAALDDAPATTDAPGKRVPPRPTRTTDDGSLDVISLPPTDDSAPDKPHF